MGGLFRFLKEMRGGLFYFREFLRKLVYIGFGGSGMWRVFRWCFGRGLFFRGDDVWVKFVKFRF